MATTLKQLINRLERRLTWKNAAFAFTVIVLSNLALMGYILPGIQTRQPAALESDFLVMIDRTPLLSAGEVYRIFDLYTPDILGLVRLVYAVDFVVPLALAFVVAVLLAKLLQYLRVLAGGWRALLLLPFAAPLFDDVENVLALVLTSQYQDGRVFPTLARVASVATACKFCCLALTGVALLALLIRAAVKRIAPGAARGA
jgi:hypothetical protein